METQQHRSRTVNKHLEPSLRHKRSEKKQNKKELRLFWAIIQLTFRSSLLGFDSVLKLALVRLIQLWNNTQIKTKNPRRLNSPSVHAEPERSASFDVFNASAFQREMVVDAHVLSQKRPQ